MFAIKTCEALVGSKEATTADAPPSGVIITGDSNVYPNPPSITLIDCIDPVVTVSTSALAPTGDKMSVFKPPYTITGSPGW